MTKIKTPDYIPCADADLNDTNRGHCYEGWTQFRDWREADEDETVGDIASYRAGYLHALNRTADREAVLVAALERLRDCDWVITLPDRMDAVREIAREALAKYRGER